MSKSTIFDLYETLGKRPVKIMETKKECAVLLVFTEKDGEVFLLFETRSDHISQPGEVCFPGGVLMEGEKPLDCALRETFEELSIPKHKIRIIGPLDILHNYTNMTIYPFAAVVSYEEVKDLQGNEEVKDTFLVPLKFFQENEPYIYKYKVVPEIGEDFPYHMLDAKEKYRWRTGSFTVPIFQYEGKIIWGITARILCHLLEILKNG